MNHPFSVMREKMRKSGFASLTEAEQWQWHADVYAFRRVYLGISPQVHSSPPDPAGLWLREDLVQKIEPYYRWKFAPKRDTKKDAELEREGRDILTQWVQSQGFVSVDDYCERHGNDELAAHQDYLKSPEFKAVQEKAAKAIRGIAC